MIRAIKYGPGLCDIYIIETIVLYYFVCHNNITLMIVFISKLAISLIGEDNARKNQIFLTHIFVLQMLYNNSSFCISDDILSQ